LSGVFIAGIFSAALSSMSSSLNTIAGTIYEDFIRIHNPNASEKRASDVMKLLVVVLGCIMLSLVFLVEHLGQVFRVSFAISGLTVGTQLGMFLIGMTTRSANSKGVIAGAIGSMCILGFIIIGAQSLPKELPLPTRTDGCEFPYNMTSSLADHHDGESLDDIPTLFKLSFMYYGLLGTILTFVIALPISWWTGGQDAFDERLLTPFCRSNKFKETEMEEKRKEILYAELDQVVEEMKNLASFDEK